MLAVFSTPESWIVSIGNVAKTAISEPSSTKNGNFLNRLLDTMAAKAEMQISGAKQEL